MLIIPKYKISTSIAVDKQKVLDYFNIYIEHENETEKHESYTCKDDSLLILCPSGDENKVFVHFHLNFKLKAPEGGMSWTLWFLNFCKEVGCNMKALDTKGFKIYPSDGDFMSCVFNSQAYRIARHYANHPKDRPKNKPE